MLMQLFVGLPLEMSHGGLRVGLVYVTGVFAGKKFANWGGDNGSDYGS